MFIGMDIGGTNTRIVTSETSQKMTISDLVNLETAKDFKTGIYTIIKTIQSFNTDVEAIGIGLPGSISIEGVLDGSTNLPGWVEKPLKQQLEQTFKCSVFVRNDAEAGALGEAYFGQTNKHSFFYITWGTGVGCAQVFWKNGAANVSRPENRQPIYNLESKIGGKNIKDRFNKSPENLNDEEWATIAYDLLQDLPDIVKGYGFRTVVIGGGIAFQQKELLIKVFKDCSDIKFLVTSLEGKAGLYGALALIKDTNTA